MQMIDMRISGISEINKALKELGSTAQIKGARAGTLAAARVLQKAAQRTVPVKTSNLQKSIIVKRWSKRESKGHFLYIVGPAAGKRAKYDGWYGRLVEFGTRKHDIYPRSEITERLRWGKEGGRFRGQYKRKSHGRHGLGKDGKFGQHVKHPGFKGRHWLENAFNMTYTQALDAFAQNYARAAFRLGVLQSGAGARYVGGRYVGVELPMIMGV